MRQMKQRESRVIALKWLISECCQTFIVTGNISFITSAPTTITNNCMNVLIRVRYHLARFSEFRVTFGYFLLNGL